MTGRATRAALPVVMLLGCPADDGDPAPESPCPWFEPQIEALGDRGLEELGYPGLASEPDDGWADDGLDVRLDDLPPSCVDIVRMEDRGSSLACGEVGTVQLEVTPRHTAHWASWRLDRSWYSGSVPDNLWSTLDAAMRDSEWQGGAMWDCGDFENDEHTKIEILGHNKNGEWWLVSKYYSSACEDPATRELMDNDILDQWRTVEALRAIWEQVVRPPYQAWWDENGCPDDQR